MIKMGNARMLKAEKDAEAMDAKLEREAMVVLKAAAKLEAHPLYAENQALKARIANIEEFYEKYHEFYKNRHCWKCGDAVNVDCTEHGDDSNFWMCHGSCSRPVCDGCVDHERDVDQDKSNGDGYGCPDCRDGIIMAPSREKEDSDDNEDTDDDGESKGGCGDCHGATGAPMADDGTDLCTSCRKNADIPEHSDSEEEVSDEESSSDEE